MKKWSLFIYCILQFSLIPAQKKLVTEAEQSYLEVLTQLSESLLKQQNKDKTSSEYGGILDPENAIYYTRAAEAVYPFTVMYQYTSDKKYRSAALAVGEWLITKQEQNGAWIENPWTWTGTTADQLLMMAAAYPELKKHLDRKAQIRWEKSMHEAGLYLVDKMRPDWASINYVPTSAATMAMLWQNVAHDEIFLNKARELAWQTIAKMDEDQFIHGEAARVHGIKYGVDLGYQIDMSLWGLTMYARITGDVQVEDYVRKSLEKVIHFVYPNGMIDSSWGARSYKWTGYGTKTADGSQVLFSMFADQDPTYQTAALRNLAYLKSAIKEGLVGYGRDVWAFASETGRPNLYPTFARAKNLAMALEFGRHQPGPQVALPADSGDWVKYFETVKVGVIRKGDWMATFSAYDYHDYTNWGNGKYTHFPRGGALLNLHVDGLGMLTTASQTQYLRGEEIHMPPIEDTIRALTPRIEFVSENGYFTNLYETKAKMKIHEKPSTTEIMTMGELSDQNYYPGGVAYRYQYTFTDHVLNKKITLRYHDRKPRIQIIEPIVTNEGVKIEQIDKQTVSISSSTRKVFFKLKSPMAQLEVGTDAEQYWYPFPGLRCYPIVLNVNIPVDGFEQQVEFEYSIE